MEHPPVHVHARYALTQRLWVLLIVRARDEPSGATWPTATATGCVRFPEGPRTARAYGARGPRTSVAFDWAR